ncbi:melanocortin receptor 5-like [Stylophora pistillata]|uniref:melanocortin receptor 5-like n=1 Tax=Stylophora pistillata TaxID=50429 RepID=UPI000C04E35D|nr:melanocortin receptor 5-like [Stylophora pistillata]
MVKVIGVWEGYVGDKWLIRSVMLFLSVNKNPSSMYLQKRKSPVVSRSEKKVNSLSSKIRSVAVHTGEAIQLDFLHRKIPHILYFISCTASILTLVALTVDRYVAVSSPVKYKTMVTSTSIWVAALGFSFVYIELGFIFYSFVFANTTVLSTFGVLIFVPVGILKRLRQRSRYWQKRRAEKGTGSDEQENQKNPVNTKDSKATKALMIVLLAFFASCTPACVMMYLLNFCLGCSCVLIHWLRDLQCLIVLCNSGINPYLYAWRLPQFKRAFYKFLCLKTRAKISDITKTSVHATGKQKTS